MPIQRRRTEFEQQLAALKKAHADGDLTDEQFYDQSGKLRFDDEASGQTWWLDLVDGIWYIAPKGSDDFKPYQPEPSAPEPEPAPPEPEASAPQPQPAPPVSELPATEPSTGPEPPAPEPQPAQPEPEPPTPGSQPAQPAPESQPGLAGTGQFKALYIGVAAIVLAAILCGVGFWAYSSLGTSTPTPTQVQAAAVTNTPIPEPTSTPPTKQPSPTSRPSDTPSATPSPTNTFTPTSTDTPVPMPTNTPAPAPTNTPPPPVTNSPAIIPEPVFSGRFAYPEFDEDMGMFNIKVIELPGKQEIFTISNAGQPSLSPNGEKLAYISWANDKIGLFSTSLADGTQNTVSTMLEAYRPQWSFDNTAKAFEFIKGEQKEIHFSDAPGSGVSGIEKGQTPAWMPDGRLVLQACQKTECGLAVVNTNGTGLEFITRDTADISPAVSPDGQRVAYTANGDIWLVGLDGGTPTQLTATPGRDGIPTWSPSGEWIAFASEDDMGRWTVQVIHPDGTGQQKLLDIAGNLDSKTCIDKCRESGPGWTHESISWSK